MSTQITRYDRRRVALRPARASPVESLAYARRAFRDWRRTRPFWGGLLIIVAAAELLVSEDGPLPVVTHAGLQGLGYLFPGFMPTSGQATLPVVANIEIHRPPGAYLTPEFMLICGVLLWLTPFARVYHSVLAIFLALWSWISSDLGGLFIGMLIGAVGGALAFAWMTDAHFESAVLPRPKPAIALPSWALEVISRKALTAPQMEGVSRSIEPADLDEHPAEPYRSLEADGARLDLESRSPHDG